MEPKRKKSEIAKKKIYLCAIQLFKERGFDNVKISDICQAADVSTGTFYYYFPSKEAVFLYYANVADEMMDEFAAQLQCESYAERLVQLYIQKVRMLFSELGQELSNTCITAFLKHRDDSSLDINRSAYSHIIKTLKDGREAGEFIPNANEHQAASILRYVIGGIALRWACSEKDFDIVAEAEFLVRRFVATILIK